jgi:hypothetical protein
MPEIELGGFTFSSKTQLKSLVRGIASHYDFDIVRALLDHHPNPSAIENKKAERCQPA